MPQGFIGQHRAKLFEDDVQVKQKKQRRQNEYKNCRAKKRLFRHPAEPKQKRAETEIDEAEKFCAVKRIAPGTFHFLKTAHLPEAVEQKRIRDKRGNYAERFEPVGLCGFGANDKRGGQSPEKRGQPARKFAERVEQFGFLAGFWILRFGQNER